MAGSGRATSIRNRKAAITNFQTFTLIHGLSARPRQWLRRNPRLSQWADLSKMFRQTRSQRKPGQNSGNQRARRFFSSLSQTSPRNLAHPPKPPQKLKTSGPGPRSQILRPAHTLRSSQKTDGTFSSHPIIFQDALNRFRSRYFFSVVGSSVKIHTSSTGYVVSTLSVATLGGSTSRSDGGHTAKITSALLNPHNPFQLITASLDGCIKFWDYLDGTLLQTIRLPHPIFMIAAHDRVKDYIFAITSRGTKRQTAAGIYLLILKASHLTAPFQEKPRPKTILTSIVFHYRPHRSRQVSRSKNHPRSLGLASCGHRTALRCLPAAPGLSRFLVIRHTSRAPQTLGQVSRSSQRQNISPALPSTQPTIVLLRGIAKA